MTPTYTETIAVWVALLLLLGANIAATMLVAAPVSYILNAICAASMAGLVFGGFMGLRSTDGLTRVFALAGFGWLAFLIALTLSDYLTRGTT